MTKPATTNRRTCERYRTVQYTAQVKRLNRFGRYSGKKEAALIDFNRNGVALCCERKYKVGDQLKLCIHSESERVYGIYAVVKHARQNNKEYYFGLQFVDANDTGRVPSGPDSRTLMGMEGVILRQLA